MYFLFIGATGTSWKQLCDGPPSKIRLELGEDETLKPTSTAPSASGKRKPKPRS